MMHNITVCFYKDFKFYWQSRMIYLLILVYTVMSAGTVFYLSDFFGNTTVNIYQFFKSQPIIMAFIVPALTMRMFADEYKYNTLEILLSKPLSAGEIVVGKFAAAWAVTGVLLTASCGFWLATAVFVPLDNGWIAANYLMTFLMCGCLCALTLPAAAFCFNALGAFIAGLGICILMTTAGLNFLAKHLFPDNFLMMRIIKGFEFDRIFEGMITGQVALGGLLYFMLLAVAALYLAKMAVVYKRS